MHGLESYTDTGVCTGMKVIQIVSEVYTKNHSETDMNLIIFRFR